MKNAISLFSLFVMLLLVPARVATCDLITLYFHERIPYFHVCENGIGGLMADPAALAFKKAGIAFQWVQFSPKRQMRAIRSSAGCDCAVGWFKNPEREQFARFTRHLYQDKPYVAIARSDNNRLHDGMTVDSVLSDPELTLAIKDGYSYGAFLDAKIARHQPAVERTTTNSINMLKKIHAGRNDYFFIAPEEAQSLIESSGLPKKDFKCITFSGVPEGEKRYIMCSRKVDDAIIKKLNDAIEKFVLDDRQ